MRAALPNFERDGYGVCEGLVPAVTCDSLAAIGTAELERTQRAGGTARGGLRDLLQTNPVVQAVAYDPRLLEILQTLLGDVPFPVRCLFFDKTPTANWAVPWHQDLLIAVASRIETPGFGPWSVKAGVPHVQPPTEILQRLATVRVHLDDCGESNGALRVIPGSHAQGILTGAQMEEWARREAVSCCLRKGDALVMRPLLLHASSSATNPSHRRVLHMEYAAESLPNGLAWHAATANRTAPPRANDLIPS